MATTIIVGNEPVMPLVSLSSLSYGDAAHILTAQVHLIHALRRRNQKLNAELLPSNVHVRGHFTACRKNGFTHL